MFRQSYTKAFYHITAQGGPEEEYRYSFTLSLTAAHDQDACSSPHPGRFPLGKETWYPLYRRLGWSQVQSGRCGKFIPAGFWTTNCPSSSKLLYWLHCLCHPSLMNSHYFNWQLSFTISLFCQFMIHTELTHLTTRMWKKVTNISCQIK